MFLNIEKLYISDIHTVVFYGDRMESPYSWDGNLPTYELIYYTEGNVNLTFNNKLYTVTAGDFLYLPKNIVGANYTVTSKDKFSFYDIYFDSETPLPTKPIHLHLGSSEIQNLFEKLTRYWLLKKDGYHFRTMSGIYKLLDSINSQTKRYIPQSKATKLKDSEEYMLSHFCDTSFDYEKLVQLSGLSYSYFKKLFIDKYGMPPVKYINHLKLTHSCELILTNKFSVSEIANMCGYANSSYFSKQFKKTFGVPPKDYNLL